MDDRARHDDAVDRPDVPAPAPAKRRGSEQSMKRFARIPLWMLICIMIATLAVALYFAATGGDYVSGYHAPPPPPTTSTPTPAPTPTIAPPSPPSLPQLGQAITALEAEYQVSLGVSISPVFTPPNMPVSVWHGGSLAGGYAWSTTDVPVAIAVNISPTQPDMTYFLSQAFNQSSAAGDQALWQWLGDDQTAAARTTAVLRAGADQNTTIPVGAAGQYAVFSQTMWSLDDQATWLGAAYCTANIYNALTYMASPPANQRFGLASIANAKTKTSWGTQPNGALSVRQLGLLPVSDSLGGKTWLSVSVAAVPLDGSLDTATAALNEVAFEISATTQGFTSHC